MRRIEFEGCFNFRDLGGWETDDGRIVRWGRIFRADSVHLMTEADAQHARERLGLRTLLDLRSDAEVAGGGAGLLAEAGLQRRHLPLSGRRSVPLDSAAAGTSSDRSPDTMVENYLAMLDASSRLIADAVETVGSSEGLPAVFFCAAGKDRTGVLSAVVLGALGVRDEDIVADYELTTESIDPIIRRFAGTPGAPAMYAELQPSHFAPHAETMQRVIEGVRATYGSFADYLIASGAHGHTLDRLRAELLAHPATGGPPPRHGV